MVFGNINYFKVHANKWYFKIKACDWIERLKSLQLWIRTIEVATAFWLPQYFFWSQTKINQRTTVPQCIIVLHVPLTQDTRRHGIIQNRGTAISALPQQDSVVPPFYRSTIAVYDTGNVFSICYTHTGQYTVF